MNILNSHAKTPGRLVKALENFLGAQAVSMVFEEAKSGRRNFLRNAFAAASLAASVPALAQASASAQAQGDPHILNLPEHSRGLGQAVASDGYGKPSKFETNVQRRTSPGLTQTAQASVSFAPLQSLFGIVTPSGLHFERHHQGWWDIDPSKHRLMINGADDRLVKTPMVFTMDEIMRLPSVSRFHFIECGANTGMDNKIVGPGFKEVAKKYAERPDAVGYLAGKIRAGGSGLWGSIPMPAQGLSDADAQTIAKWLAAGANK